MYYRNDVNVVTSHYYTLLPVPLLILYLYIIVYESKCNIVLLF